MTPVGITGEWALDGEWDGEWDGIIGTVPVGVGVGIVGTDQDGDGDGTAGMDQDGDGDILLMVGAAIILTMDMAMPTTPQEEGAVLTIMVTEEMRMEEIIQLPEDILLVEGIILQQEMLQEPETLWEPEILLQLVQLAEQEINRPTATPLEQQQDRVLLLQQQDPQVLQHDLATILPVVPEVQAAALMAVAEVVDLAAEVAVEDPAVEEVN